MMYRWPRLLLALVAAVLMGLPPALAQKQAMRSIPKPGAKQTVCTMTINSPDEKEAFRRHLPESKYRFVELVERGRPDWLASACQAKVSCDVLVVSAHYDGGNEFFSDQIEVREFLTVSELERVSCGGSCPTLFSRLKEVYLFGCNTLNAEPQSGASAEIVRALVREGQTRAQAERELHSLTALHGESSLDRMRQIFKGVPVIYGFSSTAPLGPIAGSTLERYFRTTGDREMGQGRTSSRLLGAFSPFGMAVAQGMGDKDAHAAARADMCQFADDRVSTATRLAFVHELLQRHVGEARLYLDRIQRLTAALDTPTRQTPAVAQELEEIALDGGARERVLDYARATDQPSVRVRLLDLAREVGWLGADEQRAEIAAMLREVYARRELGVSEINLACSLNPDHRLDGALGPPPAARAPSDDDVAHAALRACLGSDEGRTRALRALLGPQEADVRLAQAYLRHRPLASDAELRQITDGVAAMGPGDAQVRALEALGRHYVADGQVLGRLVRLFIETPSAAVQSAVAGILIRADRRSIAAETLARTLAENRRPSPHAGDDMVDALIGVLQSR
jgi:hypothetical protein